MHYEDIDLLGMMKKIFYIFSISLRQKKVKIMLQDQTKGDSLVETDSYYLFHSLLSLIDYSISMLSNNSIFKIIIHLKYDEILDYPYYHITFHFKGKLDRSTFENLPYKNAYYSHII